MDIIRIIKYIRTLKLVLKDKLEMDCDEEYKLNFKKPNIIDIDKEHTEDENVPNLDESGYFFRKKRSQISSANSINIEPDI